MRSVIFVLCVLVVTAYLAVVAWEDHKTCEVTRWKHLLGLSPAIILFCMKISEFSRLEVVLLFVFVSMYVLFGYLGVYGVADGFVLAILTLSFGAVGGVAGIGIVIVIMIVAGFSFMINHLFICMRKKRKLFQNVAAAFLPHIFVGYIFICVGLLHAA